MNFQGVKRPEKDLTKRITAIEHRLGLRSKKLRVVNIPYSIKRKPYQEQDEYIQANYPGLKNFNGMVICVADYQTLYMLMVWPTGADMTIWLVFQESYDSQELKVLVTINTRRSVLNI